jgi:hypothetical protein
MTRWRDPIALATIMGPIIAVIITYIIPSIPLPVTPVSTQTQPHESKPVDETGQIGKSKAVERRDVPPEPQCNDSYPDVCIQSDIDCSEILVNNFKVNAFSVKNCPTCP